MGGAVAAVEIELHEVEAGGDRTRARLEAIERGEQIVVGVNKFIETEPSPLSTGEGSILTVPHEVEAEQIERLNAWRAARDARAVAAALKDLRAAAAEGRNIMPASIAAAKAGVTTGEWGAALREAFGEYRAPTGVGRAARNRFRRARRGARRRRARVAASSAAASSSWSASRGSTAIPTAPSRSRCARAMPAWRWSTRASA